jgi:hypothetical protein
MDIFVIMHNRMHGILVIRDGTGRTGNGKAIDFFLIK